MDFLVEALIEFVGEVLGDVFGEGVSRFFQKLHIPKWLQVILWGLLAFGAIGLLVFLCITVERSVGIWGMPAFLGVLCVPIFVWLAIIWWNHFRYGTLRKARKADLPHIMKLYRSVIGTPGCHWSIAYPNEVTLHEDFCTGNLYVLWKGKQLIGAGSIVPKNELDDLPCWQHRENTREIARIVIDPSFHEKGHGRRLILKLCRVLHKSGCKGVHLLASAANNRAKNLYRECGFYNRGPCHRYDHDFYAYERKP